MDLPPAEHRHVEAAEGWLGLGAISAANDELDEIAPELRAYPEVLIVRARVFAAANRHLDAAVIAEAVVRARPDEESSWLQLASYQAQEEIHGFVTALNTLHQALVRFPRSCELWFHVARVLAASNEARKAEAALKTAVDIATQRGNDVACELKLRALDDYYIATLLWPEN